MSELISTFGISTVIVILIITIPALINFISWCKKTWKEREHFKEENFQRGREIEARSEAKEARLVRGEMRMGQLEKDVADLKDLIAKQQDLLELLIASDELDIKSWIKAQHEKWVSRQCIDSQTLDLLEQRFSVYESEGGNSWAKKLVEELRALPIIISIDNDDNK